MSETMRIDSICHQMRIDKKNEDAQNGMILETTTGE